jgi:asparagine synthase (glutamine-hydrolysing)
MSGIVGLWNVDGQPADGAVLTRMAATLRHRAIDGEDVRIDEAIGIAHQHAWTTDEEVGERQPLTTATSVTLALDGRLDNRDDLLAALDLPMGVTDAACALAAYERWDEAFVERLEGEFAVAVADPRHQRLLLARDALGIRPLYYVRTPRLVAFASEIKALLAHPDVPVSPDDEGLADYLMLGARPLDRQDITCFAGVSAVIPSHVVNITPDRLTTRRYWDFDVSRPLRLGSVGEYVEAFGERFREAVRRRARGSRPIAVSTSGGLDSSSVFCEAETLRRAGRITASRIVGVSYVGVEGGDADEREYLLAIEREYGVAIDRFPAEPLKGLVCGADDQVRAVEAPFIEYMWGITCELHRRASASGARVLLTGTWGDQLLFSTAYLVDLFRRCRWRAIVRHTREYQRFFGPAEVRAMRRRLLFEAGRHYTPRPFRAPLKWIRRRLRGEHRQKSWYARAFRNRALRFADRPALIGQGFHSAHAASIYLEARSKYHVQCMEWNNKIAARNGLDISFPFLDRDLVAFLIAVPGEIQNQNGVPRALIREAMRGVLPEAVRARRWKADFSGIVNDGVAQDFQTITQTLSADPIAVRRGYLDGSRLASELPHAGAALAGPTCTTAWDVADLYGLEIWLRVFLHLA